MSSTIVQPRTWLASDRREISARRRGTRAWSNRALPHAQRHRTTVGATHEQRDGAPPVDPRHLEVGTAAVARHQFDPVAATPPRGPVWREPRRRGLDGRSPRSSESRISSRRRSVPSSSDRSGSRAPLRAPRVRHGRRGLPRCWRTRPERRARRRGGAGAYPRRACRLGAHWLCERGHGRVDPVLASKRARVVAPRCARAAACGAGGSGTARRRTT